MNEHTRITVPLSRDEFEALRNSAFRDYRHPREQARYLLRCLLLGEPSVEMNNRHDAKVSEATSITAVGA